MYWLARLKFNFHFERCFQFSVCNFVNTHRTPTIYISVQSLWNSLNDGESLFKSFVSKWMRVSWFKLTRSLLDVSAGVSFHVCLSVLAPLALLFRAGDASLIFCKHLKKIPHLQRKNCLAWAIKIIGLEFRNYPARFTSSAIILPTCQIGGHEVKNWGSIDPLHCCSFSQKLFREIRS